MNNLKLIEIDENYKDLEIINRINQESFPETEKIPLEIIFKLKEKLKINVFAIEDEGKAIGFTAIMEEDNFILLFLIAIDKNQRGKGYGSKVMKLLENYKNEMEKHLCLFVETPDENSPNYNQRISRIRFYERFDYKLSDKKFEDDEISFTLMSDCEQNDELFEQLMKKFMNLIMENQKVIEDLCKENGLEIGILDMLGEL